MSNLHLSEIASSTFYDLLTTLQASQLQYGGMTYPSQGYSLVPPGGPGRSSAATPVGSAYEYFAHEGIEMPESQRTIQKEVSKSHLLGARGSSQLHSAVRHKTGRLIRLSGIARVCTRVLGNYN